MSNPYDSPRAISSDVAAPRFARLPRVFFFLVNFLCGSLLVASCVTWIVGFFFRGGSPTLLLGGLALVVPSLAVTAAESLAFVRRRRDIERVLAFVMLGLSGFGFYAVAINVAESIHEEGRIPDGFGWFILIGLAVSTYFLTCGAYRLWDTRKRYERDAPTPPVR